MKLTERATCSYIWSDEQGMYKFELNLGGTKFWRLVSIIDLKTFILKMEHMGINVQNDTESWK